MLFHSTLVQIQLLFFKIFFTYLPERAQAEGAGGGGRQVPCSSGSPNFVLEILITST